MQKARLQKVVDHLRKVRVKIATEKLPAFNMEIWGEVEEPGVFKARKDLSCMTSACAIGHTAHLFKKQGFKLKLDSDEPDRLIPFYKTYYGIIAVSKFFDLTLEEADYLFHPSTYHYDVSISEVADRIEDFIHGIKEKYVHWSTT